MKVKAPNMLKKIIEALSSKTNELRIRMMIFFLLHKNLDKSSLTSSLQALVSHHPHHHRKKKNDDVFEEDQLVESREDEQEQEGYVEHQEEERSKANYYFMNYYNKGISMDMVSNSNTHDHMNNVVENMSSNHQVSNEYDYHDEYEAEEEEEQQPRQDLTRSLFEESKAEMEVEGEIGEVAVAEGGGRRMMDHVEEEEEPREDIDQAADLFIQRFKKQMLLQKQRSLERQQWLLLSNA